MESSLSIWLAILIILLAGGVGGLVNAFMTDNGFIFPKRDAVAGQPKILRPGCLGNVLIGGIGAVISWGLYGPASSLQIIGSAQAAAATGSGQASLSVAALVGALLVGVGGARWLSNEVDKNLLKAAASQAANKPSSPSASQQIAVAPPAQALDIANRM